MIIEEEIYKTCASDKHVSSLLEVKDLSLEFCKGKESIRVLDQVNLNVEHGEIVGLIGESGSGKTVLSRTILGLMRGYARIKCPEMSWERQNMLLFSSRDWEQWRRKNVAVIWQNPQSSLVPVYTIKSQFDWLLRLHGVKSRRERENKMLSHLERVGLVDPERSLRQYPNELSGGECQRVMIAMALSHPIKLLIADEPTSNLDVILQSEIMHLIQEIAAEQSFSILFITHDLALASHLANRVVVLYQGRVVEEGITEKVFQHPEEDYTKQLVASVTL